ncbi:MAG: hypothetical protein IKO90_10430 [Bacteroidales bacterium]|nr:hypothetical protein [Bacteroidales bacterium]
MVTYKCTIGNKEEEKIFGYLPKITNELDKLNEKDDFSINTIRQITLWKLDRYVDISEEVVKKINSLKSSKDCNKEKIKEVLLDLLKTDGVGLPMASTYLRFRNPQVFQIIDARAYRAAFDYTKQKLLLNKDKEELVNIYIKYLDKLREIAETGYHGVIVKFKDLDRFLYDKDKEYGFKVNDKYPYNEFNKLIKKYGFAKAQEKIKVKNK